MKHKVLKSKGISLIGRARGITYGTVVEAVELGPDARRKAMYYVDFYYELENGHVRADIFFDRGDSSTNYEDTWDFDMPIGWIPTDSQLVQLAEEAVRKHLMGHFRWRR